MTAGVERLYISRRFYAVVDADIFPILDVRPWHAAKWVDHLPQYAATKWPRTKNLLLHRVVLWAGPDQMVDHINGDTMDNRRSNLRFCTRAGNNRNSAKRRAGAAPYKGIQRGNLAEGRWQAKITLEGRSVALGSYDTPEEAASAYDRAARLHYGEFARLNFPDAVRP